MIWAIWFGVAVLLTFLGLELWSVFTGRPTLSWTVYSAAQGRPYIPLIVGVLLGWLSWHFFGTCG